MPQRRRWTEDETGLRVVDEFDFGPSMEPKRAPLPNSVKATVTGIQWQIEAINHLLLEATRQGYSVSVGLDRECTFDREDRKLVYYWVLRVQEVSRRYD